MCRPETEPATERVMRMIAATVLLGAALAGCSNPGLYLDRRDTIALSGGDAVAANMVAQMNDPRPAQSGNTNLAFNGQKMQSAIERYRTGKVTRPVDPMALEVGSPSPTTPQNGSSQNGSSQSSASSDSGSSAGTSGSPSASGQ